MKNLLIAIFLLCSLSVFSQLEKTLQFGLGISSITNDNDAALMSVFDTELTFRLNRRFSTSLNLNTGLGTKIGSVKERTIYQ